MPYRNDFILQSEMFQSLHGVGCEPESSTYAFEFNGAFIDMCFNTYFCKPYCST